MDADWKALPTLSSLRAFELVARHGNFAAAARALNVTHAAIAQQVRGLEAELGVALARRAGRSIALTPEGARLAGYLTEGFGTLAEGIADLRAQRAGRPVQVAATVFIAQSVLLPRLPDFWRLHPGVQVLIMPSNDVVDIAGLGMDLAIRTAPGTPDWPGLRAEPLFRSEVIAVGVPALVDEPRPTVEDLPWIWSRGVAHEERALRQLGLDTARVQNVDLGAPILQLSAALQGLGLTFSTEILVHEDIAAGRLRRVPMPGTLQVTYYAVTPEGPVRPQTAAFIDWLKATLGPVGQA